MANNRTHLTISATDFLKPWEYADITFKVEGHHVYANKTILSMWSPVFAAMFHHNFREKKAQVIPLPGKNLEDILEMMAVLHPPNKEISGDNAKRLLPLCQEYQTEAVTLRCEDFLISQPPCINNYILAKNYALNRLEDYCLGYLKRAPLSRLKNEAGFDQLEKEMLLSMLLQKCDVFESNMKALQEICAVLDSKDPSSSAGELMLCHSCTSAHEQQVDCVNCMKICIRKMMEIQQNLDKYSKFLLFNIRPRFNAKLIKWISLADSVPQEITCLDLHQMEMEKKIVNKRQLLRKFQLINTQIAFSSNCMVVVAFNFFLLKLIGLCLTLLIKNAPCLAAH